MSTRRGVVRFPQVLLFAGFTLWGLAACQTRPPAAEIPPVAAAPEAFAPAPGAHVYAVVPAESLLQIFVYRGGAMARLGHNHVIASRQLAGVVHVADDPLRTRFDIDFPVSELTVDEPGLRELAGPDFPPEVPQSARDGTRANLLSPALLDAPNHPRIRLRATDIVAIGEGYEAGVEVTLRGQAHAVRVPVTVRRSADALVASGEFPLRQSQLGLTPFSVAMGTLVVLDEMRVRFEIVARERGT
jgi:hypothetical protein